MEKVASLDDLKSSPQWIVRDTNKQPYTPRTGTLAKAGVPATWGSYKDAVMALKKYPGRYAGLGYQFLKQNGITGIDLDHCVHDDGSIEQWALDILQSINSYAEYSPNDGIHIFVYASLPDECRHKFPLKDMRHEKAAVEMYDHSRYFTITGRQVSGTPDSIEHRQDQLDSLRSRLEVPHQRKPAHAIQMVDLSDYDLIEKACNAPNGSKFAALLRGDISAYNGDESAADQAFCNMLAFWTGRDAFRMDRIFRQSGLYREKWDRNARSGETYGEGTIRQAIASCTETYDPLSMKVLRTSAIVDSMIGNGRLNGHAEPSAHDQEYIPPCQKHTFAAKEISIQYIRDYMDMQQLGDAQLFARCFEGQVVYDSFEKEWYLWQGHHWQRDMHDHIRVLVSGHLGSIYLRATAPLNEERACLDRELILLSTDERDETEKIKTRIREIDSQIQSFIKRAKELRGRTYNTGVLYFTEALMAVPTRADGTSIWDSQIGKIGVKNGVLDLHTGICRDGEPGDYIRTFSPTEWKGLHAPCPHFETFLQALFELREDREEVIAFLRRLLGYALTGTCKEAIFALLYGPEGRNGKSTLFKIIFAALGKALAGGIANELLVDSGKSQKANGPKPDLLELQGKRIAVASETQKGDKLDISAIKRYTGGDELGGRPMFGKHNVRFDQTHTLFLHTNFKPHADPADEAFWARACLIEFNMRFVEDPDPNRPNDRKYDTGLERRIIDEELSGVLAFLVRGAMDYDQNGLKKPQSVKLASEAYRTSEDTLQTFINDCCAIGSEHSILSSAFIAAYKEWSSDSFKLTGKELKKQMEKKGFKPRHSMHGSVYESIAFVGEGQGLDDRTNVLMTEKNVLSCPPEAASEAGSGQLDDRNDSSLHKVPHTRGKNGTYEKVCNSAVIPVMGGSSDALEAAPQAGLQGMTEKKSPVIDGNLLSSKLPDRDCIRCGSRNWRWDEILDIPVCTICASK